MKEAENFVERGRYTLSDLLRIVARLRAPDGCPWDREQDHKSIRRDFLEECYEAVEAIDNGDSALLREELGDVLFQIVFHTELEREAGRFDFSDVVSDVAAKMVERHPHVFGTVKAETTAEVLQNWDSIKRETKRQKTDREVLQSVSPAMPALMRTQKVLKKAAALSGTETDAEALRREIGDTVGKAADDAAFGAAFLKLTELSRLCGVDAERALFDACRAFIRDFEV